MNSTNFPSCLMWLGSATSGPIGQVVSLEPLSVVSGADDESFLVDQFEQLLEKAVSENKPFLAVLFFHGVHIPCTDAHTPSCSALMTAARSLRPLLS